MTLAARIVSSWSACLVGLAGLVLATAAIAQPITIPAAAITSYTVPTTDSRPTHIATGPDGALWFTESFAAKMGRITTGGSITEFDVGPGLTNPFFVTNATAGGGTAALWFTRALPDRLSRMDTTGAITDDFVLFSRSQGVTQGLAGTIWVGGVEVIQRYDPPTVTRFGIGVDRSVTGTALGSDDRIWFTIRDTGTGIDEIGAITAQGAQTIYPIPSGSCAARSIAAGPSGDLWFAYRDCAIVGRITTQGVVTEYPFPASTNPGFTGMVLAPDGNMWVTLPFLEQLGRIDPATGAVTLYDFPGPDARDPQGIAVGPDGALWFVEWLANRVTRLDLDLLEPQVPMFESLPGRTLLIGLIGFVGVAILSGWWSGRRRIRHG